MRLRYLKPAIVIRRVLQRPLLFVIITVFSISLAGSSLVYASIDKGKGLSSPRIVSSIPLARGKFLVARGAMLDPHFNKTVVYLIDYNPLGAIGIIINRPLKLKLSKVLPELEWLKGNALPFSWGGPVENRRITILTLSKSPLYGTEYMGGNLYAGWDILLFKEFLSSGGSKTKAVRVFGGYAGWAPGQLDAEVARGGWRVMEAPEGDIFRDTTNLWFKLMGRP